VKRLIGRGGFAEVYELWDKDLDRRLACKVLHPEIAWTPGMLARFRQEAKALARLQHPAILAIHFTGDGEGLVFYVMPFVEGESLAERLRRRGPYSADEALKIAEPILQALSHAHAQGLVHRDIKPDNVMLETKSGRALLVDFGIAKLFDPSGGSGGGGGTKTATGFTVGTVQYMSPEQALGQPNLDGRSDLYAFGAMLYQMVTGTPPYDGNSSAEIVGKHLSDPVPVASDVNAKIPRWLSTAIVKCLAKRPEDRFQNADKVLEALEDGHASGSERLVGTQTLERQVRRSGQVRRRSGKLGWWLAGVVVAALVAGGLARRAGYLGSGVASLHNALVEPIEVLSNGVPVDTVAADATERLNLPRGGRSALRWRLVRPGSPPIGEPLEGPLPAFPRAGGRLLADVSADVGGQRYFAPLITNGSASDITLEVNPGTAAAVRCNCLVSKGAVRTHIGYYRLYQNSTVAAYNSAHPYIGPHTDRHGFAGRVGPQSGSVVLTF
jgi:serine/threonine-protein kinase